MPDIPSPDAQDDSYWGDLGSAVDMEAAQKVARTVRRIVDSLLSPRTPSGPEEGGYRC